MGFAKEITPILCFFFIDTQSYLTYSPSRKKGPFDKHKMLAVTRSLERFLILVIDVVTSVVQAPMSGCNARIIINLS